MSENNPSERIAFRGSRNKSEILITVLLGIVALIAVFPFYNVLIVSFADSVAVSKQLIYLLPNSFDLSSYEFIFKSSTITGSFFVSVLITFLGTAMSMVFTTAGAYALSKKDFPGRNIIMKAVIFTMFFSGGLIPLYLTVKNLGLYDNLLALIFPSVINTFYLIIMINYFKTIPDSLEESARIDGANDLGILIKIVFPISTPTIAAISLFYAVDQWNAFYFAMLFIKDNKKYPLQLLLREVLVNYSAMINSPAAASMMRDKPIYQESLKMAVVVLTAVPILMVYPLLQKYFTKGIMIGSIKG